MTVALIDAGGANLGSVRYALERLGIVPRIARRADELAGADRIILPGVGAAAPAMEALRAGGLDVALRAVPVPVLGICLGMQLLFDASDEGDTDCLGAIPGRVRRMAASPAARVPHMGWNALSDLHPDPLLDGVSAGDRAYFVHGYAAPVDEYTLATSEHGGRFSAVVRRGRYWGVQFHPERSADCGARMLRNFLGMQA